MEIVGLIFAFILAVIIVNGWYKLLMKITGASAMYFSIKGRFMAYFVVTVLIIAFLGEMFG